MNQEVFIISDYFLTGNIADFVKKYNRACLVKPKYARNPSIFDPDSERLGVKLLIIFQGKHNVG